MTDEKKMRDLMARLVAMTPEPPPYPEEAPMVRHQEQRRTRPALAFVAAAALVALLAIPLLLFTGEDGPILIGTTTSTSSTTTTTPDTSTTTPASTSTTEPSTTTTTPSAVDVSGVVFLYQTPENSFGGGNPALVPLEATISGPFQPDTDFLNAWQMFISGGEELPSDLQNAVPAAVVVESTTVEGDVIVAEMSDTFVDGADPAGLLADMTMLNQLIYTLTYEDPDAGVLFTVNEEPVAAFGSEGIDLTQPVDRESFQQDLAQIYLTQPVMESDGIYTVAGLANTFEASLTLRIVDSSGETVHEEPVQASAGTGVWGDFSVAVDADLITPGESSVQLFTYSAKDGSESEMITVPIPEAGVWEYTVGG